MSSLQGGKFGHGFASAGFTEAASPIVMTRGGPISQGTTVALMGGTASAMTGGKFANGAVTAAFGYAFNELLHYDRGGSGEMTVRSPGEIMDTEPVVQAVVSTLNAGENAAMYWATMAEETGNPLYDFLGGLASLWTPDTALSTATTLIPVGGGTGAYLGRPFRRYIGPASRPNGRWFTRGWGWNAPYGTDFVTARSALQLPHMPTSVVPYHPKWYQPVIGPGVVNGNYQWGFGGGLEYYRGWWWPTP